MIFRTRPGDQPASLQREVRRARRAAWNSPCPSRVCSASTNPHGACPRCQGFGNTIDYDMDCVIQDKSLSLDEGAVDPWTKPQYRSWALAHFRKHAKGKRALQRRVSAISNPKSARPSSTSSAASSTTSKARSTKFTCASSSAAIAATRSAPTASGSRLAQGGALRPRRRQEPRRCRAAEHRRSVHVLRHARAYSRGEGIAEKVLVEVRQRLKFLNDVGLQYLTLDRLSATLSGGEAQRIHLATCSARASSAPATCSDEPSIGLHARDTARLVRILEELRDIGNTIIVVEHDPDVMRSADHIIDLGPGAGEHGGKIVFSGPLSASERCATAR